MFAGHFGLAAGIKAKQPAVPLAALMLSSQLLDVVFVPLYVAGIETMEPVGEGHGAVIIHAEYSHALLSALLLALAAGWAAWKAWGRRGGIVIGLTVFSHWLLDLIVHRPDLPLLPGNLGGLPLMGWGLWQWPPLSIGLELLLVAAGAALYFRSALKRAEAEGAGRPHHRQPRRRAVVSGTVMAGLLILSLVSDLLGVG